MSQTNLSTSFWGYAVEIAALLLNRTPTKAVEKTPYEIWIEKKRNMSFLRIRGCESHIKKLTLDKLAPKTENAYLCDILRKPKDITFATQPRTKCLLLERMFF